jgi:two-component system cell cycle response regulator
MKVLVAEDNPVSRKVVGSMLSKWGYEVVMATNGDEALRALQAEDGPELAILDWMMPGIDGVEVCRRVRQGKREPYIYMLLLTARTARQDLLEGMDAGADDYVTKPYDTHELRVRIRAGRRILELQAELVKAREALRDQATRDGLTGIWNRNALFEVIGRELARSTRERLPLAVVMADLDRFKHVNDVYGHLAGDAVLREAARRMSACMRPYDAIGRYGGEEFVVVLPGCDAVTGRQQAERLRAALADEPFRICNCETAVTCSLGVAWTGDSDVTCDSLIRAADQALYDAKRRGRNRVQVASVADVPARVLTAS